MRPGSSRNLVDAFEKWSGSQCSSGRSEEGRGETAIGSARRARMEVSPDAKGNEKPSAWTEEACYMLTVKKYHPCWGRARG